MGTCLEDERAGAGKLTLAAPDREFDELEM
jgi:hypothetical protein